MLGSFVNACVVHEFLMEEKIRALIDLPPSEELHKMWYPLAQYQLLCDSIEKMYQDSKPIFERIGQEMVRIWYNYGPGKEIVSSSIDFLKYQVSSDGYYSLVKGESEIIGEFKLEFIDEENGIALIKSSTPLNRYVELGVLLGGLKLFKQTLFANVTISESDNFFFLEFH